MQIIADLQLHSKYSRAVSPNMTLSEISRWCRLKGIDLVATGDWTHPLWFRSIKENLKEISDGIYSLKDNYDNSLKKTKFLLSTEISSIYSQDGKVRRVHNLIFSPSIEVCEKIIKELNRQGCNLMADGRPIVGISSVDLLKMVMEIDERVLFIPAHCLTPNELIETTDGLKTIDSVKEGDSVLTHNGRYRKVFKTLKRKTKEIIYKIIPWYYSQGIETTKEHPYYAIKTIKCSSTGDKCIPFGEHLKRCSKKTYQYYKKEWIQAKNLSVGDFICFPIIKKVIDKKTINIGKKNIKIDENFCLLIGYFLSKGCIDSKRGITFTFSGKELKYVKEVILLMDKVFNIKHYRIYKRKESFSYELIFYSKAVVSFLEKEFYIKKSFKNASTKKVPNWIIYLPQKLQKLLLISWFRGNGGYTSSVNLVSSINKIALRLGIICSISVNKKENYNNRRHFYKNKIIKANFDNYQIKFTFIKDKFNLLKQPEFKKFKTKITRRHGFMDNNYVYLPIRKIEKKDYQGYVYNLEVKEDNSYSTWVATIHNCWTPWFSIFGSKSGFDSIYECFGDYEKYIYAIETGLSSDPIMNWQIKELKNRSIVSFSDAHSGQKIGREATVFIKNPESIIYNSEFTYNDIADAIKQNQAGRLKIGFTIEFFPEEGKYHWSGHRACNIRYSAKQIKEKGIICPVCNKPLTIGVENRVLDLSEELIEEDNLLMVKNKVGLTFVYNKKKTRRPFVSIIPLFEVLLELNNYSQTKGQREYQRLTTQATEFDILLRKTYEEIEKIGGRSLRQAIEIIRERKVFVDPGYDGVFGKVKIFRQENEKINKKENQQSLF